MADLTYTATGWVDTTNEKITVDIYLPQEDPTNPYEFNFNFNLSKKTIFNKQYNVVFCHLKLKKDMGIDLNSQTKEHQLTLDINKLIRVSSINHSDFDFKENETLFLLLHDDSNIEIVIDSELLFNNIESIYGKIKASGNQSIKLPSSIHHHLRPRRLGMSIIR